MSFFFFFFLLYCYYYFWCRQVYEHEKRKARLSSGRDSLRLSRRYGIEKCRSEMGIEALHHGNRRSRKRPCSRAHGLRLLVLRSLLPENPRHFEFCRYRTHPLFPQHLFLPCSLRRVFILYIQLVQIPRR